MPERCVHLKSVSNFGPLSEISVFFLRTPFLLWVGGWVGRPRLTRAPNPPRPSLWGSMSNGLLPSLHPRHALCTEIYIILAWVLRGLITNHPCRRTPRNPVAWPSLELPFAFEVSPKPPEDPGGSKIEAKPCSPKFPATPVDFRTVAQYLLRRDDARGGPPSPALPASPQPARSFPRGLTSPVLLPSSLVNSPPQRSAERAVKRFSMGTLVQHNLVCAHHLHRASMPRAYSLHEASMHFQPGASILRLSRPFVAAVITIKEKGGSTGSVHKGDSLQRGET